ncbi:MAG: FG-GAP repeat protein [Chthoniobacterales bacterium]
MNLSKLLHALLFIGVFLSFSSALHATELTASDGATDDRFGFVVGISGATAISGAYGKDGDQGAAYIFQDLNTATGVITENAILTTNSAAADDLFAYSVGISGAIAVAGAYGEASEEGAAYIFRDMDTASGAVTETVKLTASDGVAYDRFGRAVGISGATAIVGAYFDDVGSNVAQGSAYVFRNMDTATGSVTENVKLTASDGAANDELGRAVGIDGTIAIAGAFWDNIGGNSDQGSAYVFRDMDTATGSVTQNVKLTASDGLTDDELGISVGISGAIAIAGADQADVGGNSDQGAAYIFRDMNTATGSVTENAKLVASDGAEFDYFGDAVAISGTTALVSSYFSDIGGNADQGAAYIFQDVDTATGTITENMKLFASDGAAGDRFGGRGVGLDGDNFVIGAYRADSYTGKAYTGSISSMTTLDAGNTSRTISRISFISQDDWIIGQSTDNNSVTLSTGDSGDVTAAGKAVYIGQNTTSDNNSLTLNGELETAQVNVGAVGNSGNAFHVEGALIGDAQVFANSMIGGDGAIIGDLNILSGGKFLFDINKTLSVTGSVSLTSTFGIDDLIGMNSSVAEGIYDLIDLTMTDFSSLGIQNWGINNARYLGGNKIAYFQNGLQVIVTTGIPEPSSALLLLIAAAPFLKCRLKK